MPSRQPSGWSGGTPRAGRETSREIIRNVGSRSGSRSRLARAKAVATLAGRGSKVTAYRSWLQPCPVVKGSPSRSLCPAEPEMPRPNRVCVAAAPQPAESLAQHHAQQPLGQFRSSSVVATGPEFIDA